MDLLVGRHMETNTELQILNFWERKLIVKFVGEDGKEIEHDVFDAPLGIAMECELGPIIIDFSDR